LGSLQLLSRRTSRAVGISASFLLLAVALLAPSSCTPNGSETPAGRLGVGWNESGELVLHVHVCKGLVNRVTLLSYAGEPIIRWTSDTAQAGVIELDPASPPNGWANTLMNTLALDDPDGYRLLAGKSSEEGFVGRFQLSDLALVDGSSGEVVRATTLAGEVVDRSSFARQC